MRPIIFSAVPLLLLSLATPSWGTQDDVDEYVAVHVGKLIVGNGEERDDVTILILDGKVEAVGRAIELPHPCREIDARDSVAMPGLIHSSTRRGLLNINRNGVAANRKIVEEFLPEEDAYDGAAEAGFTTLVLAPPAGSGFPGRAMVIRTADLGEGLIVQEESWVAMGLPRVGRDKAQLRKGFTDAKAEIEKVEKARKEWEEKQKKAAEEAKKKAAEEAKKGEGEKGGQPPEKKAPGMSQDGEDKGDKKAEEKKEEKPEEFKAPPMNPALVPLVQMIQGKGDVFGMMRIGNASTYLHMRDAMRGFEVPFVLISSGRNDDLFLVADQMGENGETVLIEPELGNIPYSIDRVNPAQRFIDAGCTVGFFPSGDSDTALGAFRYQVGELLKAGTDRDAAIQAMTLNVATALGLGDRLGSVEKGKDANMILLSGDIFDVQAEVQQVVLEGEVVYDREEEDD